MTSAYLYDIILSEGEGRNRTHLNWTERYNQYTSKVLFQLRVSQQKKSRGLKKPLDKFQKMCYNKGTKERGTDREKAENREVEGLGAEMPTHRSVPTFFIFLKKYLTNSQPCVIIKTQRKREVNTMNNIIIDNMNRQCIYNNLDTAGACPIWVWVLLGVVVLGFIGFIIWVIKETWIW